MKTVFAEDTLKVLEGAEVSIENRVVTVKGKYGELTRSFKHMPVDLYINEDGDIKIEMWLVTRVKMASIHTLKGHIRNMMIGVTRKYQFKMRAVFAHFPIITNIPDEKKGDMIEIRNFLGEKRVRLVKMLPGVHIERTPVSEVKDQLVLTGTDLENVSRSCALIYQSALVRNKDIRKFLDGIYVSERGTVEEAV